MCSLLSSTCELLGDEQGGRAYGAGGIGRSHSLCVALAWFKDKMIGSSHLSLVCVSLESGTLAWPCSAAAAFNVPGNKVKAFGKQVVAQPHR